MGTKDRRIDVWMDKRERWQEPLAALRALMLEHDVQERFKWRQPVYAVEGGGNIVVLHAMKDSCGINFFNGALLTDPDELLEVPGPNTRFARRARFTSLDEVKAMDKALRGFIQEAIDNEKAGKRVETGDEPLELPEELEEALANDAELAEAFDNLTPGRQRGYAVIIGQAKQSKTRTARVEKHRERILAGKGIHDD